VPTSALICLDNPALFLAFRPSENCVLTPLTNALAPERELSPETKSLRGPPPGRNKGAGKASAALRLVGASMLFSRRHRPPTLVGP
jgi:hypothetical protein